MPSASLHHGLPPHFRPWWRSSSRRRQCRGVRTTTEGVARRWAPSTGHQTPGVTVSSVISISFLKCYPYYVHYLRLHCSLDNSYGIQIIYLYFDLLWEQFLLDCRDFLLPSFSMLQESCLVQESPTWRIVIFIIMNMKHVICWCYRFCNTTDSFCFSLGILFFFLVV